MTQIPRPPCTATVNSRINSTTIPTIHKHTLKSTPPTTTPIQYVFDCVKASVGTFIFSCDFSLSFNTCCVRRRTWLNSHRSKQTRSSDCYTTPLMMTNPIETTCWVWLGYLHCASSTLSGCFVLFLMGSSRYLLGCTVAAVSAHQPAEHVKNAQPKLTTEGMTQTVVFRKLGPSRKKKKRAERTWT